MGKNQKLIPELIEQSIKLKINLVMLRINYEELISKIEQHKDPEIYEELWNILDPQYLTDYVIDVSRLYINFVSLACGVKESCRVYINDWYKDSEFLGIYQKKVDELFRNNPFIQFTEDLRNIALHCNLTVLNARGQAIPAENSDILDTGFVIKKSRLMRFISEKGKEYLIQQPESIDIEPIVRNYFHIIDEFYTWLISEIYKYSDKIGRRVY